MTASIDKAGTKGQENESTNQWSYGFIVGGRFV